MRKLSIAVLSALFCTSLAAAPNLVPIAQTFTTTGVSSNPSSFLRAGSLVYFMANDGVHGIEPWKSDGTPAGTAMIQDLTPGTSGTGADFVATVNGAALLYGRDSNGLVVWRTDGTSAGTYKLFTALSADLYPYQFAVVDAGSRAFILMRTTYEDPGHIYVTDGTPGSVREVPQPSRIDASSGHAVGRGGKLYFIGNDATLGPQLWVSDGTSSGTRMFAQNTECPSILCPSGGPGGLFLAAGMVHFWKNGALYRTDGTSAGTVKLADTIGNVVGHSDSVSYILAFSGDSSPVYRLDANGLSGGTGRVYLGDQRVLPDGRLLAFSSGTLMITDGTAAGTRTLATFARSGLPTFDGTRPLLAIVGNRALVSAGTTLGGVELMSVDLDQGGATLVKDIDPRMVTPNSGYSSNPAVGAEVGGRAVFAATNVNGRELWISDGTTAGTLLVNIAADTPTGSLSGVVRDGATQAPVANALVYVCKQHGACDDNVRSDANGAYRFDGLPPSDEYVVLVPATAKYLRQGYDKLTCSTGATCTNTSISVKAGFETTNIDFALEAGGSISGRVTSAATGVILQGVPVNLYNSAGKWLGTMFTDPVTGTWATPAYETGTYYAFTDLLGNEYGLPLIDQLFRGKDCSGICNWQGGDPITVTRGADTTGIDFALHGYGHVTGTVKDTTGQPIAYLGVSLLQANDPTAGSSASTNLSGTYLSGPLAPGSYIASVPAVFGFDAATSSAVTVSSDSTASVDLVLHATGGTIVGRLVTAEGNPARSLILLLNASGQLVSSVSAGYSGEFTFSSLAAGTYYLIADSEFYGGTFCFTNPCSTAGAKAVQVTATDGAYVLFKMLAQRIAVSGTVVDSVTGKPLANVSVTLYGGTAATPKYVARLVTDVLGQYWMSAVSRDTPFRVSATSAGYHPNSYQNVEANCPTDCSSAPYLPAGDTFTVDFAMRPYGSISGTVIDALTGTPVSGAIVHVGGADHDDFTASTDANGRYRAQGGHGSYLVWVSQPGYTSKTYPNQNCSGGCPAAGATPVNVPDGSNITGIDLSLQPSYSLIQGHVVDDATGAPLAGVVLQAETASAPGFPIAGATTDANGAYLFRLNASGSIQVTVRWAGLLNGPARKTVTATGGAIVTADFRLPILHVNSIVPAAGSARGGTRIAINGAGFTPEAKVTIGGQPVSVIYVTPNQIVATTPPGTPGYAHVVVTNSDAQGSSAVTLAQGFRYVNASGTRSDFDGDGKSDMLWVNSSSGDTWGWLMDGAKLAKSAQITTITPSYQLQGIGDFDRDGKSDLVWVGTQGDTWIWLMNGLSIKSSSSPYTVAANFRLAGVGDFDGDGQSDLLWVNPVSGDTYLWLMNGSAIGSSRGIATVAPNYRVAGVGDFDGDGKSDILWFNTATGDTYLWLMNGQTITSSTYIYTAAANYAVTGVGDFDGDGKSDLLWFNAVTGDTYIWLMNGAAIGRSAFIYQVANNFRIAGVGDFDGDGKSDLVWRNTSSGDTYVWLMNGTQFTSSTFIYAPTTQWSVPAPGAF